MRIDTIELSWFRGAAQRGHLDTGSKSMVIYGANGSGKSTFADALEYVVADGRVSHLSHEYSGRRQEKGIRNTHAPDNAVSRVRLSFQRGATLEAEIATDGTLSLASDPIDLVDVVQSWSVERLILRQDEVAKFIHATKGQKYSVLLPLLGLEGLEQAAENLHRMQRTLDNRSNLSRKRQRLQDLTEKVSGHLRRLSEDEAKEALNRIAQTYIGEDTPELLPALAEALAEEISARIGSAQPEQKLYLLLGQIHEEDLAGKLAALTEAERSAEGVLGPLLDRRIAVLEPASEFAQVVDSDQVEIDCPACGRAISVTEFVEHVQAELEALKVARSAREEAKNTRKAFASSLDQLRKRTEEAEFLEWLNSSEQEESRDALARLAEVDLDGWEQGWPTETHLILRDAIPVVSLHIAAAANAVPPSAEQLIRDKELVEACKSVPEISALQVEIARIQAINDALTAAESGVRHAINARTSAVVKDMSTEVQRLWSKLHPDEPIENIELYIPRDAEKAIDIGLKFFGVDQPSPRLTLSEGHRNSLGLCIFLSLMRLGEDEDRPIILDDIVSSMDREHRGMLVDILLEDLADHQLILLTHDREWYTELRSRLPAAHWKFMVLRPWESPELGLQWSVSTDTFDDAQSLVPINPEAAGNRVRAIMDAHWAIAAEKLRIQVPYLRADRNDHRTCLEFLERIISEAATRLRRRQDGQWLPYAAPIDDWKETRALLISWANRASHTGTLTSGEANRLIEVCERAVGHFRCTSCGDPIWIADQATRDRLQCACGEVQWRYG